MNNFTHTKDYLSSGETPIGGVEPSKSILEGREKSWKNAPQLGYNYLSNLIYFPKIT